jgi:hypothetical protein
MWHGRLVDVALKVNVPNTLRLVCKSQRKGSEVLLLGPTHKEDA